MFGPDLARLGKDDPDANPRIDFDGTGEPFEGLLEKFDRAGLVPVIRDVTSDLGISCVVASATDDSVPGFPQAHGGIGAHPNARIAAVRALAELAQSRAVDIQGVREDLQPAGMPVDAAEAHLQRVQKIEPQRWLLQQEGLRCRLSDLPSVINDDVVADIRLIISRLAKSGMERVIVVDFSEPGPFSVVRVLVPGLEYWALDKGRLGKRAARFWKEQY
jgi:ribosomal protein S12 methylthiotransferase accessory factor